jgi:hypothetical protein
MQTLSEEIVHGNHSRESKLIEFSPLDLFVMGHHTHGPIFGFERPIDPERFRSSLKAALDANPEMGAAIEIGTAGTHSLRTEAGVQLVVQRAPGPMPAAHRIATLPLREFPLAHASMTADTLIEKKLPLLGFRITQFEGGACTLGIRTTHSHLDGVSLIRFLVNLGEIYNGGPAHSAAVGRGGVAKLAKGDGLRPSEALRLSAGAETAAAVGQGEESRQFAHTQIIFDQEVLDNYVGKVCAERPGIKTADIVCALAWKAWALSAAVSPDPHLRLYSIFNLRQLKEWPRCPGLTYFSAPFPRVLASAYGLAISPPQCWGSRPCYCRSSR